MTRHDRLAAHELLNYWYVNYDEGHLQRLAELLTADCVVISRTEAGDHPLEAFIASHSEGREAAVAWMRDHRLDSPYPLRHNVANIHVVAERGDELDLEAYLHVTKVVDRVPAPLSSGLIRWTLRLTPDGYRVARRETVLDSIPSAPFKEVPLVAGRAAAG